MDRVTFPSAAMVSYLNEVTAHTHGLPDSVKMPLRLSFLKFLASGFAGVEPPFDPVEVADGQPCAGATSVGQLLAAYSFFGAAGDSERVIAVAQIFWHFCDTVQIAALN